MNEIPPGEEPERIALPRKPRRDDRRVLRITGLTRKGDGRAFEDVWLGPDRQPRRLIYAVGRAFPGDLVEVEIRGSRHGKLTTRVLRLVEPAPGRIEPRCAHYGVPTTPGQGCGGCSLQGLDDEGQLQAKVDLLQRLLAGEGVGAEHLRPAIPAREPFGYRGKIEPSFGLDEEDRLALGFRATGRRYEVLRLRECHLVPEPVSALLVATRQWAEAEGLAPYLPWKDEGFLRSVTLRVGHRTGELLADLISTQRLPGGRDWAELHASWALAVRRFAEARDLPAPSTWWTRHHAAPGERTTFHPQHLAGPEHLEDELHVPGAPPLRFTIHPHAFFQPNPSMAEVLYGVVAEVAGGPNEHGDLPTVLDLYCGTGTIGLSLAHRARHVVGIELVEAAVDDARRAAERNHVDNATFLAGDVAEVLGSEAYEAASGGHGASVEAVIVDPPRAGLLPGAVEALARIGAPRLVYVSCNPAALARDLGRLRALGYRLEGVTPVDLFPQTPHIECVAELTLGAPG